MSMTAHERFALPHALYRIFAADGTLLYIGCSQAIFSRLTNHGSMQPWRYDIAKITVEWYPNEILGRRAEAAAILAEKPTHNRLKISPDAVGFEQQYALVRRPRAEQRGDGVHCPKCGGLIENKRPGKAYCNACFAAYRRERWLRLRADKV